MLVAELVVVFLGVYGAFWVENFRDQQDREERTGQVIRVLQQDLKDYIEVSGAFNDHIKQGLREWSEARDRGETPPPFVFRVYGAEKPPLSTWEAVRQAQLAELLQANLLYELGFFYNELSGIGDRYVRYAVFTEVEVLPLLKTGSSSFYLEDGSRLLPRFEAHMDRLREYKRLGDGTVAWATCLLGRLESADDTTTACRTDVGVTMM
jgi:hypothetical protein